MYWGFEEKVRIFMRYGDSLKKVGKFGILRYDGKLF